MFRGASVVDSYVDTPHVLVPMALRELHQELAPSAVATLRFFVGESGTPMGPGGSDPDRTSLVWPVDLLNDVVLGAGFQILRRDQPAGPTAHRNGAAQVQLICRRERTLSDSVGDVMGVLLVGLNPSLHAADVGFGFAGHSNRFWPAALEAGLVTTARDPNRALSHDYVGMTDIVKRATPRAAEIDAEEYRIGLNRLDRLCQWLRPGVVCVVGITGWRAAIQDRTAQIGLQKRSVGGRITYVMPNPSGLNAHTNHLDLVEHFTQMRRLQSVI
jgi:TDG/mug DNA glycosylase family protein